MALVSTPVIVAVCILGCCLVTTSALLVYKLRPGSRQKSDAKGSRHSSDASYPVRKMTIVRGMVVEENPEKSKSILPRWSEFYASRRASFRSTHYGSAAIVNSDTEAQRHDYDYEKSPRLSTEEVLIDQPIQQPKPAYAPWTASSRVISPRSSKRRPTHPTSMSIDRKPVPGQIRNDSDRRHTVPNELSTATPQPSRTFDPAIIQAASITAAPRTAYSARVTPAPSLKSSGSPEPEVERQSIPNTTRISSTMLSSQEDISYRTSQIQSKDLGTVTEASPDHPSIRPLAEQNQQNNPIPEFPLRSRSDPTSSTKSPRRSDKHRPSPIRTDSEKSTRLSAIAQEDDQAKHEADHTSAPRTQQSPTIAAASMAAHIPLADITNLRSPIPYTSASQAEDRQSMATIASSQYSPTFSLVKAQRMPLPIQHGHIRTSSRFSSQKPNSPFPPTPKSATPTSSRKPITIPKSSTRPNSTKPTIKSPFSHPFSTSISSPHTPITASLLSPSVHGRRPSRYSHLMDKELPPPPPVQPDTPPDTAEIANTSKTRTMVPVSRLSQAQSPTTAQQHSQALTSPLSSQSTHFSRPLNSPPVIGAVRPGEGPRSVSLSLGSPTTTSAANVVAPVLVAEKLTASSVQESDWKVELRLGLEKGMGLDLGSGDKQE